MYCVMGGSGSETLQCIKNSSCANNVARFLHCKKFNSELFASVINKACDYGDVMMIIT